ncbi:MAG: PEP-CTERM sorting domain-containing protein [Phycisphaerae bacterium]|nr:PEP-CTERM sorting domain-containing protein [Phycisphaerae bacterium]
MRKTALVSCLVLGLATVAGAQTFSNPAMIDWAGETAGAAVLYPSEIEVSGLAYSIESVTVTLFGLSHTWCNDLDILLVGPTGASVLLLSDAGGGNEVVDINLTFADGYPEVPSPFVSGTYCPTDVEAYYPDEFPAPAPVGPWDSEMAAFTGTDPNGTWSLYVYDDVGQDTGAIAGGWSITVVPEPTVLSLLSLSGLALVRRRR